MRQLAESLVDDGHQVRICTTDAAEVDYLWDPRAEACRIGALACPGGGPTIVRSPLRHLPLAPWSHFGVRRVTVALAQTPGVPESLLNRFARYTPWVPDFAEALRDSGADLVHSFAIPFESLIYAAEQRAAATGVPHVITPFLHVGPGVERGYAMPHQMGLMRRAAAVVALTEIERDFLVSRGLNPSRLHVIPAGIPEVNVGQAPSPAPTRGDPTILYLGALTYDKGVAHLIEAVRALREEETEVRLVLAGDSTEQFRRYYRRLEPGTREFVEVPGVVTEERKQELLAGCTALALPSRVDSFGIVMLEAWAAGKPVIAARAGGIPAVVDDGKNGLLVPFGDVAALRHAIRRLVERPDLAAALGAAGYEKLEAQYRWDKVYPQLLEVYDRVLR